MNTKRKIGIGCTTSLAVLAVIVAVAAYFLGPTVGAMFGRPFFMGHVTPERYASSILTVADNQGYYANSAEYSQARDRAVEAARTANTLDEIYTPLKEALKAAGGKHSNLITPTEVEEYNKENPAQSPEVLHNGTIATATVPAFDGFSGQQQAYADTLAAGLNDAVDSGICGVVVDLRGNTGGDMGPMVGGLTSLLPDGTALEFATPNYSTPVTIEGNSVKGGGSPVTVNNYGKYNLPVAVLVDKRTASSGEATMLAFRGLEYSRSFGQPTAGYASANIAFEMPDGAQVLLTTSYDRDRTGQTHGDDPVAPDEVTEDPEAAAREWLQAEYGCGA
ncbi:S41 family peptidase [Corynebacterium sp. S7]